MGARILVMAFACGVLLLGACHDGDPPAQQTFALTRLKVDRDYLRDKHGRYVLFHGVNLSGSTKVPTSVDAGDIPTYIGKPFQLADAKKEFARIRSMGFNVIRLLVVWEAIEPKKKGEYDQAYLTYIRKIVEAARDHGIYVLMDMHQDMFSRHLKVKFNSQPEVGEPGSLEYQMMSLVIPYDETVQGDGAPKWAVQACMPEKKMDSKNWGTPRILSGMDGNALMHLEKVYKKFTGAKDGDPLPTWIQRFTFNLPGTFPVNETTDMLPFTNWPTTHALSLDVARAYACLLAGDKVFPTLKVGKQNIKDYLQEAYANAWVQVARQVKGLDNVIGYDIINEPGGNFITLSAVGGMIKYNALDGALKVLKMMLGDKDGADLYKVLVTLKLLPPDTKAETLKKWGMEHLDVGAAIGLNNGFDQNHMRPFFERVGKAIVKEDPRALIFIEHATGINVVTGGYGGLGGLWETPMEHPRGPELKNRVVWAPHWYPDIYPTPGFNAEPRQFTAEQVRYRNYEPKIREAMGLAKYSLGNIPTVFGEFGTYFNYNNTYTRDDNTGKLKLNNKSKADGYIVSSHIFNNYFEAMERVFASRILWCYSSENTETHGDLWNREDFSVLGPDRKPRSELAWSRPYARALAGKPVSTHFHSDFHYFDPAKGTANPKREFVVRYASKETSAPTEIFVPKVQYGEGFYVWVSDGFCHYDNRTNILYHYPSKDEPGAEHWVKLRPPISGKEDAGWKYFFKGDQMVGR